MLPEALGIEFEVRMLGHYVIMITVCWPSVSCVCGSTITCLMLVPSW